MDYSGQSILNNKVQHSHKQMKSSHHYPPNRSDVHNNRLPHSDRHCIRMESRTGQFATRNRSINHYPETEILNALTFN